MDARRRAREEDSGGGFSMDVSSSYQRSSKRPRAEDPPSEEEKDNQDGILDSLARMASAASASASPWRLPSAHTLADNQRYLNEQLQHVVALSGVVTQPRDAPENGTRRFLAKDKAEKDDVDDVCTLQLEKVWEPLSGDQEVERGLRGVMDLVSYLLYVRDRELAHQNRLSESLNRVEKQLERKSNVVQTLTADLETAKQNNAQRENVLKAREQALMNERKTLQVEKKALEVNCARCGLFGGDLEEGELTPCGLEQVAGRGDGVQGTTAEERCRVREAEEESAGCRCACR
jgi:hypothetical protein